MLILIFACTSKKIQLPQYTEFVSARQKSVPDAVQEIYGRFAATASGKTVRSTMNLLLEPGKNAYLEILNPSGQLLYSVSLNTKTVTLLWAQDGSYVEEPANSKNLEAILGFPIDPDDLLFLIGGYGLDFSKWQVRELRKDGWDLIREGSSAELHLRETVSRITIQPDNGTTLDTRYEDYQMMNDRMVPRRMKFELPEKKISLELFVEKFLPRSEPVSPDLFSVQFAPNARWIDLRDIYEGKPLLFQQ